MQIAVNLTVDSIFENNEVFRGILSPITTERVSLSPDTADAVIIGDEGIRMYMYTHYL